MGILVSKNVQPQSFSLINGTANDLIQYFGQSMTDKQVGYLPILLYSRHDKITGKPKKDGPDQHTQAGNILGMKLEHFKAAHLDYNGSWLNDYAICNVASTHADHCVRLRGSGRVQLLDGRRDLHHAQAHRQKSQSSDFADSLRHEEVATHRLRRSRSAHMTQASSNFASS